MTHMNSTCGPVRAAFSGYLDGAINGREMQRVAQHLAACESCEAEFAAWRGMQRMLAVAGPIKAPEDLGLRLRLAISHENARRQGHWWDGFALRWQNLVRPLVLQASAGFAGALVLVGTLALLVGVVAAPEAVLANDEPLGALTTPHYLYSAARLEPVITTEDRTIVVEADINANGRVYDYTILGGTGDAATETQVRDQLMLLVYQPAMAFGEPVRGRVLITFSGVSVHS